MRTFVIIKPDAIARGLVGKIISRFEQRSMFFEFVAIRIKDAVWCKQQYNKVLLACESGRLDMQIYERLEDFMVGSPLLGIILGGDSVIDRVRYMIGPTNCLDAFPGTIRGDFGEESGCHNLVHSSDSEEAVDREIKLFFEEK